MNGLKTADYVNKHVRPYMGTSPVYIENNASIRNLLQSPIGTQFELEIKRPDGSLDTLQITREKNSEKAVYPERKPFTLFEFKWLNNEIAYVALNSFSDAGIVDEFKKKLPDLYRAKSLIIDLRNNTGGSNLNAKQIFKYLTYDSVLYGARSSTRQHNATYKAWGSYIKPEDTIHGKKEWGIDKTEAKKYFNYSRNLGKHYFEYQGDTIAMDEKRIVIPTMVLIGNRTASAAEDFLILSHKQEHLTTVGEPTFGSTGQPVFGDLPGGGRYRICTKKDTYPNGKEFVGYGIQPQIKVTKKLIDFIENNDVVLDMALQHLTK